LGRLERIFDYGSAPYQSAETVGNSLYIRTCRHPTREYSVPSSSKTTKEKLLAAMRRIDNQDRALADALERLAVPSLAEEPSSDKELIHARPSA
jgi:hypothetical protein